MKCPGCGYVSFDRLETCKRCGAPMSALSGFAPRPVPAQMPDDALELSEEDLAGNGGPVPEDDEMPFHLDDDIFAFGEPVAAKASPAFAGTGPAAAEIWQPFTVESPDSFFVPPGEDLAGGGGEPVIDRDEEIPERFWAPEIAGLGRRAAALLVDQAILAVLVGVFFAAAYLALGLSGFDAGHLLSPAGLRAALAPFAMLALLLSLVYQSFFHAHAGCTPGKALAGVEVRTADGAFPSRGRVLLRWAGAALGLAAAGLGLAWALFEPRRRGWADLLSGTVVARRRR